MGTSLDPLKAILNDALKVNKERTRGMTKIYFPEKCVPTHTHTHPLTLTSPYTHTPHYNN